MKVEQDVPVALTQKAVPFAYKPFDHSQIDAVSKAFYVAAMAALDKARIPFLVGGAYAFAHYSGIDRHTKDFDIFVRKEDAGRILDVLARDLKCKVDRTFHWLYKAILGENFIDIIFSSGNGIAIVDDGWFNKAPRRAVLGVTALLVPAEEMIWSKGFIMERERYDGADVAHILRGWGKHMDWARLISRFGNHWRVLFSHLVLFGFIYPNDKDAIPSWVMSSLSRQLLDEHAQDVSDCLPVAPKVAFSPFSSPFASPSTSPSSSFLASLPASAFLSLASPPTPEMAPRICQGTLLSRQQYLKDVAEWEYEDARTHKADGTGPFMSDSEVAHWTAAAFDHGHGNASM